MVTKDDESRIAISWKPSESRQCTNDNPRDSKPSYIHFTLQKTNRDTNDALAYLSRTLYIPTKDFGVAGTKDKRGVTVQRVSVRRGNKTCKDIWNMANGFGRLKTMERILGQRADHGIRIGDLDYRKTALNLGMLKGNYFVITLRAVTFPTESIVNEAIDSVKHRGFINYYGMQRFGSGSIPTHVIGLALLRSDWNLAVSLILRPRPGEHPDAEAARRAWLEQRNLTEALRLMPRRIVAERCLLESYQKQKGEDRNALGALSTIPRNLRLMYVHAYQSYVWNAIVSERIRRFGSDKPLVGDLVLVSQGQRVEEGDVEMASIEQEAAVPLDKSRHGERPMPQVKVLNADDLKDYTIFDVVMPLPGQEISYPGGDLGQLYRKFVETDGLDPDNWIRKQKEYTLRGSYRKILHLPKDVSWKLMKYTDPDVALAQADEDALLGFDAPEEVPDGLFNALQLRLQLGTAAYATMALREVLQNETGSQYQSELTRLAEDQNFKGSSGKADRQNAELAGG